MNRLSALLAAVALGFVSVFSTISLAQTAALNTHEMRFMRSLLLGLACLSCDQEASASRIGQLQTEYGLNASELAAVGSAVDNLRNALQAVRDQQRAAEASSPGFLPATTLATLQGEQARALQAAVDAIFSQLRPETAARMKRPGDIISDRLSSWGLAY